MKRPVLFTNSSPPPLHIFISISATPVSGGLGRRRNVVRKGAFTLLVGGTIPPFLFIPCSTYLLRQIKSPSLRLLKSANTRGSSPRPGSSPHPASWLRSPHRESQDRQPTATHKCSKVSGADSLEGKRIPATMGHLGQRTPCPRDRARNLKMKRPGSFDEPRGKLFLACLGCKRSSGNNLSSGTT